MSKLEMKNIIPRWEWRTFGAQDIPAENRIKQHKILQVRESQETYILSPKSDVNIKIRNHILDVKKLESIDENGLELWTPLLKLEQPFLGQELTELFQLVDTELKFPSTSKTMLGELLGVHVQSCAKLKSVDVHKKRYSYKIEDVMVELADLNIENRPSFSIAVENKDPAKVIGLVKELDLINFKNINYINALRDMVGFKV